MTPTFSLCYASARPHLIAGVVKLWESRCRHPERLEWNIVIDDNKVYRDLGDMKGELRNSFIAPPYTRIRAYNEAAKMSTGHWLVCVADDWEPCDGWDEKLSDIITKSRFGSFGFKFERHLAPWCIHVFDGFKLDLMTHPVVSRAWYDEHGYFLYPGYTSWYSDADITEEALSKNQLIKTDLGFSHLHPDNGLREADAVDLALTDEIKERDRLVFEQRRKDGFPLLKP